MTHHTLTGQTLGGRYEVGPALGLEEDAALWFDAIDRGGGPLRKVSVQALRPDLARDEALRRRFTRMFLTLQMLRHPTTFRVEALLLSGDGHRCVIGEATLAHTLRDEMAGGVSLARLSASLAPLEGALDELHSMGAVHRNIKPESVLLQAAAGRQVVRLAGFYCVSKSPLLLEDALPVSTPGMVTGTPQYMSPEQFLGKKLDGSADLYSLGVVLYEMVTGRLPFTASTPFEWASAHIDSPAPAAESLRPGLPPALCKALRGALAKKPEQRPPLREFFAAIRGASL